MSKPNVVPEDLANVTQIESVEMLRDDGIDLGVEIRREVRGPNSARLRASQALW